MAGKPPYFPFYVRDFCSDGKVEAMSPTEVGAYILLLCKAWLEEPPGSIPADDAVLARWARLDAAAWSECRARVLGPFTLNATDNRYYQKRMQQEYRKLMTLLKRRSEGGKKGALNRWRKGGDCKPDGSVNGSPNGIPNSKNMAPGSGSISRRVSGDSNHSPPEDGGAGEGTAAASPGRGRAVDALDANFDRFWRAYPKKAAKQDARIAWSNLNPDADLVAQILRAVESQRKSEQWLKGIIPNAANWLVGCRWEDELPGTAPAESPEQAAARRKRDREARTPDGPTVGLGSVLEKLKPKPHGDKDVST